MSLPQELKRSIEHAYTEMIKHEKRALIPIRRSNIYDLLNSSEPLRSRKAFKWLSVITARHTLSVWQKEQPDDKSPEYLVEIAEKVIDERESVITASEEAGKAWERIERLGAVDGQNTINYRYFYAYIACYEALMEVLGRDPFSGITIDENSTDSDLDPWCSDTALWAAIAYSGPVGDPRSDVLKRQEFWEWWLREAITTAWNIANNINY